jgi:hypothetical protein
MTRPTSSTTSAGLSSHSSGPRRPISPWLARHLNDVDITCPHEGLPSLRRAGSDGGSEVSQLREELQEEAAHRSRSIKQGAAQDDVEAELGTPQDAQEFEQQIPELQDNPSKSSCTYYPEKGKALFEGRSFRLCFDEGKLTSKNAY